MPAIALFQPDIPQNTGAVLRLGACLALPVHVIGPTGFDMSDRALKRAALDYLDEAALTRHRDWATFRAWTSRARARLIVFTTAGAVAYTDFAFSARDVLVFGRESAGAPAYVHAAAHARLVIPLKRDTRSLNVATAVAMAAGEALRQTEGFPRRT